MIPKSFIGKYSCCILLLLIVLTSGCGMFKNIGSDVVRGASTQADTLGRNLIKGVREELADPETKKQVAHFVDSIVTALNNSLNPKVKGLVDTVLNHKIILYADSLVEALTGKQLQLNMKALQFTLVGKSKKDILQIRNSFEQLFREILSDSTNNKLGKIRDQLLGPKTDSAISAIVDHATKKFIDRYKTDLDPALKGDVSFISKHATGLLITLGVIAVVIILVVWWSKRRYVKLVNLLTKHINKIPDQQVYDKVTSSIKDEAISSGLEPHLRQILEANGLLANNNWNSKAEK